MLLQQPASICSFEICSIWPYLQYLLSAAEAFVWVGVSREVPDHPQMSQLCSRNLLIDIANFGAGAQRPADGAAAAGAALPCDGVPFQR